MSRISLVLAFIFLLGAGNALAKGAGGGGGHGGGHSGGGHGGGGHSGGGHGFGHVSSSGHASFSARSSFSHPVRSSFGAHTYGPRNGPHTVIAGNAHNAHHGHGDYYLLHNYNTYQGYDRDTVRFHRGGYLSYYGFYDPYFGFDPFVAALPYYYPYSWEYMYGEPTVRTTDFSYDGYVVYSYDTVEGRITMVDDEIILAQKTDSGSHTSHYKTTDQKLQSVVVYNDDGRELCLVRLYTHKRRLWRLVHKGQINVYDDTFDFLYDPSEVDKDGLIVTYGNMQVSLGLFTPRQKLVLLVNNVYGTQLDEKDYDWTKLFTYIDQLD